MSSIKISPGKPLQGKVQVPGDKSITHRALILSALMKGESSIKGPLESEDTLSTYKILEELGVTLQKEASLWKVQSPGLRGFQAPKNKLNAGNSGTTCRLLLGILAAQNFSSELLGDESLSKRPMDRVILPLKRMGARIESNRGHLPLKIYPAPEKGLQSIHYESPMSSAQVKSSCLLAGLYAHGLTKISEPIQSRDHTERMLSNSLDLKTFRLEKGEQSLTKKSRYFVELHGPVLEIPPQNFEIPGDFSSAAFFIVAATLLPGSEIVLPHVGINHTRIGLLNLLLDMGAKITINEERDLQGEPVGDLHVQDASLKPGNLFGEKIVSLIDEIPIWAVAAATAKGVSVLSDAGELRFKESDRLHSISENLKRLGVSIETTEDGIVIKGKGEPFCHPEKSGYGPGYLESFGDHRIALAMIVAALGVNPKEEPVEIKDCQCIATSYPDFHQHLKEITQK